MVIRDADVESRKQHVPRRHFVDQGVEPINEQQFIVWRRTFHGHRFAIRDPVRIADYRRHGCSGAGKGIRQGRAAATDADIGLMGKGLPLHQRTRRASVRAMSSASSVTGGQGQEWAGIFGHSANAIGRPWNRKILQHCRQVVRERRAGVDGEGAGFFVRRNRLAGAHLVRQHRLVCLRSVAAGRPAGGQPGLQDCFRRSAGEDDEGNPPCCREFPESLALPGLEVGCVHQYRVARRKDMASQFDETVVGCSGRRRIVDAVADSAVTAGEGGQTEKALALDIRTDAQRAQSLQQLLREPALPRTGKSMHEQQPGFARQGGFHRTGQVLIATGEIREPACRILLTGPYCGDLGPHQGTVDSVEGEQRQTAVM